MGKHETRDCVVIGGGPAGASFAAIVAKYDPGIRVTVLEQARFPRWHIGESTIPVANGILRDLEVYELLKRSTHIKKIGAVFIWGKDRKPWNAEYLVLDGVTGGDGHRDIIDVTGQELGSLLSNLRGKQDTPFLSFNVRRAEFDEMLLNQSRHFGADVREGTKVREVLRDETGGVIGVRWEDDRGFKGVIETPFVLDASGLASFMMAGRRIRDPKMNNFAVYGYLSGAGWKVTFNRTRDLTTLFTAAVPKGWIWYFPVDQDVMSVGAVTHTAHFRGRLQDIGLEDFFWEMLHSCPEIKSLITNARLRDDILPDGKKVGACQDWSSRSPDMIGPGWASAGDAAVFIDPVLASGLTMALMSGHRAAYTLNTIRNRPELNPGALWRSYADYARGEAASFLKLSRYFYGNNKAVESWWWEAQTLINSDGRLDLEDKQAFALATAGFFPTPRAISPEVMAPLLTNLSGTETRSEEVSGEAAVLSGDLMNCRMRVLTPFRLELQAEPSMKDGATGQLDVYYDLVTDDPEFAHRLAAHPCRIAPAMAPVVDAIRSHTTTSGLLEEAPNLLPEDFASPGSIRESTLAILRVAAIKGFIQLTHEGR